jgi:hypothetical protein
MNCLDPKLHRSLLSRVYTVCTRATLSFTATLHATNRLYLHRYLNKTPYEIITGKKPSVQYFRVFGCKCFILNKKPKASKFASKVDEGFLLGYGINDHAYRVCRESDAR